MINQKILKYYLDYKQIKKEIDILKENLNKNNLKEAKRKYLNLKEKIKKFIEEIVFLIEKKFFKESKNEKGKLHEFLHNLVFEIFFDEDHYLFNKNVSDYSSGKEVTTTYEGKIITIAKILKTKDENFWFLLEDILLGIDTILDLIEDKEFLSKYIFVNDTKETLKSDIKKLKTENIKLKHIKTRQRAFYMYHNHNHKNREDKLASSS